MKRNLLSLIILLLAGMPFSLKAQSTCTVEVTGTAIQNILPDRVTIEIGLEEYYKSKMLFGDSTLVKLSDIEKDVIKTLVKAGVSESDISVSDVGNYLNQNKSSNSLMAERLRVTVSNMTQLRKICDDLQRKGVVCFNIVKADNSNMERYERKGLEAAMADAKAKVEIIAASTGGSSPSPIEIVDISPAISDCIAYDSANGFENLSCIVRNYAVKVKYLMYLN